MSSSPAQPVPGRLTLNGELNAQVPIRTPLGRAVLGDSLAYMTAMDDRCLDLVVTSPPFGLVRKKDYGNEDADRYVDWFYAFGEQFKRILKPQGSLVIDIGGAWKKGAPTRSLYHFKLLIMLCERLGFHLAQEFYWWNPSKLPTPAEWVNIRRVRVKDAVNSVYWLSPSEWPKATNRRVLHPYSKSMRSLLRMGYKAQRRPSGHNISEKFTRDNGAAIPPNLIAVAHTESNSFYQRYCKQRGIKPHPARFPAEIPEFFVRMLTDQGDSVLDPFGGSCMTGEVCERLGRRWTCVEMIEEYLEGAKGRFARPVVPRETKDVKDPGNYYRIPRPDLLWDGPPTEPLAADGGKERPPMSKRLEESTNPLPSQRDLLKLEP